MGDPFHTTVFAPDLAAWAIMAAPLAGALSYLGPQSFFTTLSITPILIVVSVLANQLLPMVLQQQSSTVA